MKNLFFKLLGIVFIWCIFINTSNARNNKFFLAPPRLIKNPASTREYLAENRTGSGIPSLAVSRGGRIWAVWYAGITPGKIVEQCPNNYVVVATSGDQGQTWEEILVIDPDGPGPVRAFDPEVWIDPDGKLWLFWAQEIMEDREKTTLEGVCYGVWALTIEDPDTIDPEWNTPKRLSDGVMMCKPIVLSSAEWVLPVSTWRYADESAKMVVSTDNGKTWRIRGSVNVLKKARNFDEHMIVERKDGSLWMLVRTKYGIGESISNDKGFTWSPLVPSRIQHPVARFFICRLNSGNLLLVKHGPIDMRIGRSHLMAFVSNDDGHSWSNGLLLDERTGVSYPDGQQTEDGTIYITYDYNRTKDQNVLITSFTEDDIISGSDNKILEVFKRRRVISQG
ncbi:MAG: exo-alpha-sialidase, partial [Bacteroidales bacterium]|nr:exo-alpha-sialidase [Bacteroidales bacterium]